MAAEIRLFKFVAFINRQCDRHPITGRNSMVNLYARRFLSALCVSLMFFSLNAQTALSQEHPKHAADGETAKSDARATDESLPCLSAAGSSGLTPTRLRVDKAFISTTPRVDFSDTREVKNRAAYSFNVDVNFKLDSASLPHSDRWNQGSPGGQQAGATRTPLTARQKMRRAFKSAFLTPTAYIFPAVSAAITEATEDDLPHKETDDRVADGLSRFAIKFGRRGTRTLLSSGVYASLFRQDPRYYRSTQKNPAARALHAVSRVFVTNSDDGKLQPNYSRLAGSLSASAISNLWEQSTPGRDRIGVDATFRRFSSSLINGAVFNTLNEFLPDIIKIFKK